MLVLVFNLAAKSGLEDALFIERIDQNEEIFARYMNEQDFQEVLTKWVAKEAYRRLRE